MSKTNKEKTTIKKTNKNTKKVEDALVNEELETLEENVKKEEPKRRVRERLDEYLLVRVASNVKGGLTYKSSSGETYYFDDYGDEVDMELRELRKMLSSKKRFFEEGWIRVLDEEIVDYLNLHRFEKKNITSEEIDYLFYETPEKIKETIKQVNKNAKQLIFVRAREKYVNGEIDNIHVIKAIEEVVGLKLDPNN